MSVGSDKPILCVDFDGVIHQYSQGWQNGEIYDDAVPGFFDWFNTIKQDFRVVIFSTRCADPQQVVKMAAWLQVQYDIWAEQYGLAETARPVIEYTAVKIKAVAYIDDRAICFTGNWSVPGLSAAALSIFQPWNQPPNI